MKGGKDYRDFGMVRWFGHGRPRKATVPRLKGASHGARGGELWSILPGRPPLCCHHHSSTGNPEVQVKLGTWPLEKL